MREIRYRMLVLIIISAMIVSSCATSSVEASAPNPSSEGLTDSEILWMFPAEDNLMNVVDWNQLWQPEIPQAPSQGELMDAYYDWASENGLILTSDAPTLTEIQGKELTLVPAVLPDGRYAMMAGLTTQSIKYSLLRGFTLDGWKLIPLLTQAGAVLLGVVVIAGVVYFVYVFASHAHSDVSHDPYSGVGTTRIRTIMSNPKDPNNRCFKMIMNYTKGGEQVIRYGIAQKIMGANHGNSWLLAISEGSKWVTVYPTTGDLTKTSTLTKFVEVISCALITFPLVP